MPPEPDHELKSFPSIVINLDAHCACRPVDSNPEQPKLCFRDWLGIECCVALTGIVEFVDAVTLTTGGSEDAFVEALHFFSLSDGVKRQEMLIYAFLQVVPQSFIVRARIWAVEA